MAVAIAVTAPEEATTSGGPPGRCSRGLHCLTDGILGVPIASCLPGQTLATLYLPLGGESNVSEQAHVGKSSSCRWRSLGRRWTLCFRVHRQSISRESYC